MAHSRKNKIRIKALKDEGLKYYEIADKLNSENIFNTRGTAWSAMTVGNVLRSMKAGARRRKISRASRLDTAIVKQSKIQKNQSIFLSIMDSDLSKEIKMQIISAFL